MGRNRWVTGCTFRDYAEPMTEAVALAPNEIVEIAERLGVTRGSLKAQLRMAETEGEIDEEPTLNALRALLAILERAEGA
jgi:hypothetical protein